MKSNATETRLKALSEKKKKKKHGQPYIKLEGDSGIKNSEL